MSPMRDDFLGSTRAKWIAGAATLLGVGAGLLGGYVLMEGRRIGKLRRGMTRRQVEEILGAPDWNYSVGGTVHLVYFPLWRASVSLTLDAGDRVVTIHRGTAFKMGE